MNRRFLLTCLLSCSIVIMTGCPQPETTPNVVPNVVPKTLAKLKDITFEDYESLVVQSETPVLLDFWATWCGPCIKLTPKLEELADKYQGQIIVYKVNYDNNPELLKQFEVEDIPRLIYLHKGEILIGTGSVEEDQIENDILQVISGK